MTGISWFIIGCVLFAGIFFGWYARGLREKFRSKKDAGEK